jgi:ATP-dependent Lhr-like helicase
VLEPAGVTVGTVNEDFAVESLEGDVFQLGNASYRIQRIEAGRVRVEDARDMPPNIPFWLGEAPSRTDEVSLRVSRLRHEIEARLPDTDAALGWLATTSASRPPRPRRSCNTSLRRIAALGDLPTLEKIVLERFFDESGGMQLIVHSCYGSRVNRAWGLALRKRMCRTFNFELQAAATEDAIVLSLTSSHSFPLEDVARFLNSKSARHLLVQALLDAPMFVTRWRWNAAVGLALARFQGGAKVPPPLQRMRAETCSRPSSPTRSPAART